MGWKMGKNGKQIRIGLLTLTCVSAIAVLVRVSLRPKNIPLSLTPFDFPESVPLPNWQFQQSSVPPIPPEVFLKPLAQKKYQYVRNQLQLNVEMRYFSLENASMTLYIKDYTEIKSVPEIRYHPEVGFYGIGVEGNLAYLSACINPRGKATFTDAQFKQNRYKFDFQPQRLLSWLIHDEPLLDRRCLWTHFSLPISNPSQSQQKIKYLETAWFDWYAWWKTRFPPL